jgi:hypothetical protein
MTDLEKKLSDTQQELTKLVQEQNSAQQLSFTPEMEEKVASLQSAQASLKAERRAIRRQLREGIESLQNRLTFLNVAVIPLGLIILGIYTFSSRHSRRSAA